MVYDAEYFLKKFAAIPESEWTTGSFYRENTQQCCALGHCGARDYALNPLSPGVLQSLYEIRYLRRLFQTSFHLNVIEVNDGLEDGILFGAHPKERIMNALITIQAGVTIDTI